MKTHKRQKSSRIRGSKTAGGGFRQKHKGPGNRGGVGMAGSGAHKRQFFGDKVEGEYFGKQGFTSRGTEKNRNEQINLDDIKFNFFKKAGDKIDFAGYKILGEGEGFKAEISAKSASKSAIEKMNKAGGSIIVSEVKKEKVGVEKKEVGKKVVEKKEEKKVAEVKKKVEEKKAGAKIEGKKEVGEKKTVKVEKKEKVVEKKEEKKSEKK